MFGIKLSKGVNGLANDYVNDLAEDAACGNPGAALNISKADFEQNINDMADDCAAYVQANRTGASNSKAVTACKAKIKKKMHCSVQQQQEQAAANDKAIQDQLGKINYWPYLIAFLFVGVIFYLLTSK